MSSRDGSGKRSAAANRMPPGFIRRVMAKPIPVIWFRLRQAVALKVIARLGLWRRHDSSAVRRWCPGGGALQRFTSVQPDGAQFERAVISGKNLQAVGQYLTQRPDVADRLQCIYEDVCEGRLEIFGAPVKVQSDAGRTGGLAWPWNTDWRFDHEWREGVPGSFNFYALEKPAPYDVKFPWEVSRLGFLVAPTLWATMQGAGDWWPRLADILDDWRAQNPVARTINWNPMECSVRSVNLAFLAMLARHAGAPATGVLAKLLALCEMHGKYVFRTIEYTDVRGNHYAANIASLIMMGSLLHRNVGEARKWLAYGRRHLDEEILLQFCDDGIQFEKSIPYHRLVLQLYLLSSLVLEKEGDPVSEAASGRLKSACRYVASYTRPDGLAPVWGDNDDASVFAFDGRGLLDHRDLAGLAAACFGERFLAPGEDSGQSSAPIAVPLLVTDGLERYAAADDRAISEVGHFQAGGMVIVRRSDAWFMTDVGEVGLMGRGGHGHLDAMSFELVLKGQQIVVDPGSYVYTADAVAREYFRSTAAHNVVDIDGAGMATSNHRAMWRLGAEADPYDVHIEDDGGITRISGSHDGFMRLDDPVSYSRAFSFDRERQHLEITDRVACAEAHTVERMFHFAPELAVDLGDEFLSIVTTEGDRVVVEWSSGSATLADDWVSRNYGSKLPAATLRLRSDIVGSGEFKARIFLDK